MRKQNQDNVIAIVCSDIHLSLNPPVYRSNEPDWFVAMARPFDEIESLQMTYNCPVLCCGDVFDKWNSPPELVNWTMGHLPRYFYSISGQHDQPEHDINQIRRSAWQTLCLGGSLKPPWRAPISANIYGFNYGEVVEPPECESYLCVAIIHQYSWIPKRCYENAPKKGLVSSKRKEFEGYDVVFAGDNHIPFMTKINGGKTTFVNCGSIMRRKSDDDFDPSVWLLFGSGRVSRHRLCTKQDVYLERQEQEPSNPGIDLTRLIESLERLGSDIADFQQAVKMALETKKVSNSIKSIIYDAMEDK